VELICYPPASTVYETPVIARLLTTCQMIRATTTYALLNAPSRKKCTGYRDHRRTAEESIHLNSHKRVNQQPQPKHQSMPRIAMIAGIESPQDRLPSQLADGEDAGVEQKRGFILGGWSQYQDGGIWRQRCQCDRDHRLRLLDAPSSASHRRKPRSVSA